VNLLANIISNMAMIGANQFSAEAVPGWSLGSEGSESLHAGGSDYLSARTQRSRYEIYGYAGSVY
jgi:hypothetical protein